MANQLPIESDKGPIEEIPGGKPIATDPTITSIIQTQAEAVKNVSVNKILGKLKPETIKDDDGIERTIFTYNKKGNPIRVMFYNKEELPLATNYFKGRSTFVLGDQPKWREKDDWQKYVKTIHDINGTSTTFDNINPQNVPIEIGQGQTLFLVEQNPRALLDMAIILGVDTPEIRQLRLLTAKGRSNAAIEEMIDKAIATKIISDDGSMELSEEQGGEALLMLELLGDEEAAAILNQKLELLKQKDLEQQGKITTEMQEKASKNDEEILNPKALIAVHATSYMPGQSENGDAWELQTTYEATKKQIPRITQHFTMNHAIQSAGLYGNWEGAGIVILMPFEQMVETNGKPAMLNTVDTFWEVSPGKRTVLPKKDAWLVKPGFVGQGKLTERKGHQISYKTANFSPQDISNLTNNWSEHERHWFKDDVLSIIGSHLSEYDASTSTSRPIINKEEFQRLAKVLGHNYEHQILSLRGIDNAREILTELSKQPIEKVIKNIFLEAGIANKVVSEKIAKMAELIERKFILHLKKKTVNDLIRELGYEVHGGGMWAWDRDSLRATSQTIKLGAEMGVDVGPHFTHVTHGIEKVLLESFSELQKGEYSPEQFKEAMQNLLEPDTLKQLSAPMRRMLHEIGAL